MAHDTCVIILKTRLSHWWMLFLPRQIHGNVEFVLAYLKVVQFFVGISWPITKLKITRSWRFVNGAHIPMKPHMSWKCMRSLILKMMLNSRIKLMAGSANCVTFGLERMVFSWPIFTNITCQKIHQMIHNRSFDWLSVIESVPKKILLFVIAFIEIILSKGNQKI